MAIPQRWFKVAHTPYGFVVNAIDRPTNAEKKIYFNNQLKIFSKKISTQEWLYVKNVTLFKKGGGGGKGNKTQHNKTKTSFEKLFHFKI